VQFVAKVLFTLIRKKFFFMHIAWISKEYSIMTSGYMRILFNQRYRKR